MLYGPAVWLSGTKSVYAALSIRVCAVDPSSRSLKRAENLRISSGEYPVDSIKKRPSSTLSAWKPVSKWRAFWKLRTNNPAPISATVASATSAAASKLRARVDAPEPLLRLPSFRTSLRFACRTYRAGDAPASTVTIPQAKAANPRIRQLKLKLV